MAYPKFVIEQYSKWGLPYYVLSLINKEMRKVFDMKYPRFVIERYDSDPWEVHMETSANKLHRYYIDGGFLTLEDAKDYLESIKQSFNRDIEIFEGFWLDNSPGTI